ncbi:C6 transcription factor [Physcia stellaris]|nr:C6 transcription factor [Physcia stellaris]
MADRVSALPNDKPLEHGNGSEIDATSLPGWGGFKARMTSKDFYKRALRALSPAIIFIVIWESLWIFGFLDRLSFAPAPSSSNEHAMRYGSVEPSVIEAIGPIQQAYIFDIPSDFSLIHKSSAWGPDQTRTTGEINIKPGAEEWNTKIRIEINSYISDARLSVCSKSTPSNESLLFETTTNCLDTDGYGNLEAELYINVTMYIAKDAIFENLNISTDSLSINFHPGLEYKVSSTTTISIQGAGSVSMPTAIEEQPKTSSREIIIHLSSGSITGTYPLYDLLSMRTTSGSISISLTLHNASTSSPSKPATLQIDSSSGSIRAHTPSLSLPPVQPHPRPQLPNNHKIQQRFRRRRPSARHLHFSEQQLGEPHRATAPLRAQHHSLGYFHEQQQRANVHRRASSLD